MRTRTIFILAVILAVVTTGLFYYYLSNSSFETAVGSPKMMKVVQTTQPISPYDKVTEQMVQTVEIPYSETYSHAITDSAQVVGKIASSQIVQGEVLFSHRLLDDKDQIKMLSYKIPPKKRAVSIGVNFTSSVSNLIEPGDYVNVLVTYEPNPDAQPVTELLLQDIPVLAVDQRMISKDKLKEGQEAVEYKAVTFDVDDSQARTLVHWQSRGTLYLVLRSQDIKEE